MITEEQRQEMHRRAPEPQSEAREVRLSQHLATIFYSWPQFGPAGSIAGGGMGAPHIVDHRASLYPARLAYLTEEGVRGLEREVYLTLWRVLDEEQLAILGELLKKASRN